MTSRAGTAEPVTGGDPIRADTASPPAGPPPDDEQAGEQAGGDAGGDTGAAAAIDPERVLVIAPQGRDAAVAVGLLKEAGIAAEICADLPGLVTALQQGAGLALVTQEAVRSADLAPLAAWIAAQPPWSDMPFVVLTERGGGPERNPVALRLMETLGNVSLLERPFHPATLVSLARTALRSRRRQYEARARLERVAYQSAALKESESRFRLLADNIPTLAWTANPDGSIFWYNSRWYSYTGTTPEQMLGWGWQAVHDTTALPHVMAEWQRALATGSRFEMVFPLRGADGVFRPFLTQVVPVRGTDGQISRWFGTNVDISAERAAEAAVRSSEARLRFALAAGQLGSWEYDSANGELHSSKILRAAFGRPPDDAFGFDDLVQSVHGEDRASVQSAVRETLREKGSFTLECRVLWPDGSLHWLDLRGRAQEEPGRAPRLTGVCQDVTARKLDEAELRAHRERLEEMVADRTRELAEALDQLQGEIAERQHTEAVLRQSQKMEAIGQLTGGIAHDFNNLLTGISGSLELMQTRIRQGRTAELGRYIEAASDSARRAASLTHRLLAFARRQTLERRPVAVNTLAAGMEELIRRTVGPAIEVDMVFGGGLWTTLCDANQLESALLNLCINARDAMPGGGRLTIETSNTSLGQADARDQQDLVPGQYVALSVTDTGSGMSSETAANAFDPFFTTKPIGQGTGLGLSMVYGFVKQSEGHVRLDTALGRGTTLCMYLPRHHQEEEVAEPEEAAPPLPAPAHATVLVVEDEDGIRAMIVELLEERGYRVIEAGDGPGGLRAIQRAMQSGAAVDLLVTDVGLPGMNGRQLADAARELRPDLKVLFITGYAHNAAVGNRLLEANMEMLTKPFALEALANKVQGMIEG